MSESGASGSGEPRRGRHAPSEGSSSEDHRISREEVSALAAQLAGPAMEASIALAPNPTSSYAARNFVGGNLERWGRRDLAETAVLLTSEVVTNVILHARTDLVVTATLDGNRARVAVRDGEVTPPRRRPAPPDSADGRGLLLVEALATSWGVLPYGGGKAVWFEL